ncbi:hypothetical protein [Streptomyces sp. R08]|uniref:Uncharacterized protein n=1 Tax=Streptomyces sp. R08 TaxID=3238624 RepID=A0AB39M3J1_9ACTN
MTNLYAASQGRNGEWAVQRWSRSANAWVAEGNKNWLKWAKTAAKAIGPIAPEGLAAAGQLVKKAGYPVAGNTMTAVGAGTRAVIDGYQANLNRQDGKPYIGEAVSAFSGVVGAVAQVPWVPAGVQDGLTAGATFGAVAGSGIKKIEAPAPTFTMPNYSMNLPINQQHPSITGMNQDFASPGYMSPGQERPDYFTPVTTAEQMPTIAATSGAYTTGVSYGASTVTAPAYTTSYSALPSLTAPSYSTAADYGASTTVTSRDPYYEQYDQQYDQQYDSRYDQQYDSRYDQQYDSGAGAGQYSPDIVRDPQYAEQHHGARPATPTEHPAARRFAR